MASLRKLVIDSLEDALSKAGATAEQRAAMFAEAEAWLASPQALQQVRAAFERGRVLGSILPPGSGSSH